MRLPSIVFILLVLSAGRGEANGVCSPNPPTTGQTVTCVGIDTTGVVAPAVTSVTVDVLGTATVTNATGAGVLLGQGAAVNVNAGGALTGENGMALSGGGAQVTIGGTVTGSAGSGVAFLGGGSANTLEVQAGGTIAAADIGIAAALGGPTSVTVAGQIGGASAAAVLSPSSDTWTLISTGTVTGVVNAIGGGSDRLVLSGSTLGSFDVSNIGAAAQYQNFELFAVEGGSSWTLTGTGNQPWSVDGAELIVNTTSLQGNVLLIGGGAVNFDQATDGTYAGSISGTSTGLVQKSGVGAITFTGVSPVTALLKLTDGTLIVNGAYGGFVVAFAGTLGGTGLIGGLEMIGGSTLAPGNSIGTLTVDGGAFFDPGSFYTVETDASGASDRVDITGPAEIIGGTVNVQPAPGSYGPTTQYTILNAAGGVVGTFSAVTSNLAFLTPSLTYLPNSVVLTLLRIGGSNGVFDTVANTNNEHAVARTLDSLGTDAPFYNQLIVETAPGARAAYNALSGEINASLPTQIPVPTTLLAGFLRDRLADVQPSQGGGPLLLAAAPLGLVTDLGPSWSVEAGDGASDFDRVPTIGIAADVGAAPDVLPYSAWIQGFGDLSHIAGDGNAAAVQNSGGGVFVGGDLPVATMFRLGAAAGYSHQDVSVSARGSDANLDGAHAALYGTFGLDGWRARAVAAGGWQDVDTDRDVQIGTTLLHPSGSQNAWTANLLGEVGYAFDLSGVEFQPYAGADWVWLHTTSLSESGGGAANLDVDSASDDWVTSVVGARVSHRFDVNGIGLRPSLDVGWGHTFGDLSPDRAIAFASAPALPFTVSGAPLARNTARVVAGVEAVVTQSVRVALEYRVDLAPDAQYHGFGLKLGLRF